MDGPEYYSIPMSRIGMVKEFCEINISFTMLRLIPAQTGTVCVAAEASFGLIKLPIRPII